MMSNMEAIKKEKEEKIKIAGYDLMPLSEAAKMAGCTPEHLNLMARRKKIRAKKLGRNWHTTKEWVSAYLKTIEAGKSAKKRKVKSAADAGRNLENIFSKEPVEIISPIKNSKRGEIFIEEKKAREKPVGHFRWRNAFSAAALAIAGVVFIAIPILRYKIIQDKKLDETFKNINSASFFNENEGIVLGEESDNEKQFGMEVVLASENYKAKQIRFGGESAILPEEDAPLEILNVRSETFLVKKQDESKLVISWRTNKPAICEIEYSKNNGQGMKKFKESGFGFNHGVVIPGLELGTAYVYQIKAQDKWSNVIESGNYAVYSGSKAVSVVELIARELEAMFGWAKRK